MRLRRLVAFIPMFLRSSARREWQLAVLALGGLAPGVAAMVAWLNLAGMMGSEPQADLLHGWLLPAPLLALLGEVGVGGRGGGDAVGGLSGAGKSLSGKHRAALSRVEAFDAAWAQPI